MRGQPTEPSIRHSWTPDELADHWALTPAEHDLWYRMADPTRLGFALLLKFFQVTITDLLDPWTATGRAVRCPFTAGQTRIFEVRPR